MHGVPEAELKAFAKHDYLWQKMNGAAFHKSYQIQLSHEKRNDFYCMWNHYPMKTWSHKKQGSCQCHNGSWFLQNIAISEEKLYVVQLIKRVYFKGMTTCILIFEIL